MRGSATPGKRGQQPTRPIKTKRDYERALSVTQELLAQPKRDTEAELRLQALLKEMDRFEEIGEEADDDLSGTESYSGAPRRWSDDDSDR